MTSKYVGTTTKQVSDEYKQFGDELLKYSYVYYEPSIPAVSTQEKGCILPAEGTSGYNLKMTPLDNNLHTFETCKFGASVKFSDFKTNEKIKLSNGEIVKKHGLPYKIVSGYFADDPSFFIGKPNINNSDNNSSVDFNSLNAVLGGSPVHLWDETRVVKINNLNGHIFSIEWYGHFVPNITGQWEFYVESDDASYMWIGDKAVNDYTVNNADIKNGGLHAMRGKNTFIYLTKEISYPIRIQFGENRGGRNLILRIKGPDGKIVNPYNVMYYYETKSGEPYEIGQTYIALVEDNPENTKKNLFRCLIADNNSENQKVLRKSNTEVAGMPFQNIVYKTAWSGFNENDPADSLNIETGNILMVTLGGGLVIQRNSIIVKTLKSDIQINTLNFDDSIQYLGNYYKDIPQWWFSLDKMTKDIIAPPSSSPTTYMTNIINYYWKSKGMQNGDNPLQIHRLVLDVSCNIPNSADPDINTCVVRLYMQHNRNNSWVNDDTDIFPTITLNNVVSVPLWEREKQHYRLYDNVLKTGQSLIYNSYANENMLPFLMSTDNRFKLFVNELGNIKLNYAQKACQSKQNVTGGNGDSLDYTYTDTKNNELYLYRIDVNEKMGNINYLDGNKQTISAVPKELYDYSKTDYSSFGKYIPPQGKTIIQKNESDCMAACNSDTTCTKFYSYVTKDGTQNCVLDNEQKIMPIPMMNNSSIKNSKLMLKMPNIKDMTSDDENKKQIPYVYLKYKNDDIGWVKSSQKKSSSEVIQENMDNVFTNEKIVTNINCHITGDANNIKSVGGEWTDITVDFKPDKQMQIPTYNNKPLGMAGLAVSGDGNIVLVCNWWSTGCVYFSKKNKTTGVWSNFKRTLHYFSENSLQGSVITDYRWHWSGLIGIALSFDGTVGTIINSGGNCFYFTWDESKQNYTMGIPIQVNGDNSSKWWISLDMVRNSNPMHTNVNNLIVSSCNNIYFAKWDKQSKKYNNLNILSLPVARFYCGITISSDGNTIAYCDYNNKIYIAKYNGNNDFTREFSTLNTTLPIHTRNLKFSPDINNQGYPDVLLYSILDLSIYDRFSPRLSSCLFYSTWNGDTYTKLKPVPNTVVPAKLDAWGLCICPTSKIHNFDVYLGSINYPNPIYKSNFTTTSESESILIEQNYQQTNNFNPDKVGIYSYPPYLEWIAKQQILFLGKEVSTNVNKPPSAPMSNTFSGENALSMNKSQNIQGFQNKNIEPYSGPNYDSSICSTSTQTNCIDKIENTKITPLLNLIEEYNKNLKIINDTHKYTGDIINENKRLKTEMTYTDNKKQKYKYDTTYDLFMKDEKTMVNGINDDINQMLLQQNNMYTLGTIATATVLVLAIMISGSD